MIKLSYKTVLHDWRRYLPVAVAIGISGLLMVMQLALAMGAFTSAAAPVALSRDAIWVGPADASSLDQSSGVNGAAAASLWMLPQVAGIETYNASFAELSLRKDGPDLTPDFDRQARTVQIIGLETRADAALFGNALPPHLRAALAEPDTVVLDRADARNLKLAPGDRLRLNGREMRLIGTASGLRGSGLMTALVSEATARGLTPADSAGNPGFYLLRLKDGASAGDVIIQISGHALRPELRGWTADDLKAATIREWATETGMGTMFLASSAIALVVTLLVVSQTLGAAVAGSIREFAALRAYGVPFRRLQGLVIAQGTWVGAAALVLTAVISAALLIMLQLRDVRVVLTPAMVAGAVTALLAVIVLSNLMAVRRLRHADPAGLLR